MAQRKRKHKTKLFRWKQKDLDQGVLESFFNTLFLTNKSEKKKTLALLKKTRVDSLLFYTDVRNLPNILQHGLTPLKNLKLRPREIYYVWSFDQDEETVSLEFDFSSRGNFWKWVSDLEFHPERIVTIGINPKRLSELTQKDWLLDWAQNMVVVSEEIYIETFDWILVQDVYAYKQVRDFLIQHKYPISLYYGHNGVVKIQRKQSEVKSPKLEKEFTEGDINGETIG